MMERTRKEPYYYLTSTGDIDYTVDNGSDVDKRRYKIGNYFDVHEARIAQKKFIVMLGKTTLFSKIKTFIYEKRGYKKA